MKTTLKCIAGHTKTMVLIAIVIIIASCQGPEGPPGLTGPPGYDGEDGLDGINYTQTAIYDLVPADWSGDLDRYTATLNVPEINDDIYYNGAVLGYQLIEIDPKSFNLLPYTFLDNNYAYYMDFDVYIGGIDVFIKEIIDNINTTARPETLISLKVVIIQGLSLTALSNKVDIRNFEAVSKYLEENTLTDVRF
jgi:hypothetical protein